jgi:hypothetical protein
VQSRFFTILTLGFLDFLQSNNGRGLPVARSITALRPYFSQELVSYIHHGAFFSSAEMRDPVTRRGWRAPIIERHQGRAQVIQIIVAGVPSPLDHRGPSVHLCVATGVCHFLCYILQRRGAVHNRSSGAWECTDHMFLHGALQQSLHDIRKRISMVFKFLVTSHLEQQKKTFLGNRTYLRIQLL